MKRCPKCRRNYTDETLNYCLDDGTLLLDGPGSGEIDTAVLTDSTQEQTPTLVHHGSPTGDSKLSSIPPSIPYTRASASRRRIALIGALVLLLTAAGIGAYRFLPWHKTEPQQSLGIRTRRVTGDGKTSSAAISPDGKFLAYGRNDGEKTTLAIKQIQTGTSIDIAREFMGIADVNFSPDSNYLYFSAVAQGDPGSGTIYKVPSLGGIPVKIVSPGYSVAVSPGMDEIAFLRLDPNENGDQLWISSADGSSQRELLAAAGKQFFDPGISWSPDGKSLAVTAGDSDRPLNARYSISIVSTADASQKELTSKRWADLNGLVWEPNGSDIDAVALDWEHDSVHQVFRVSVADGNIRRLTQTSNEISWLSMTSDGVTLATIETQTKAGIWVALAQQPDSLRENVPGRSETRGVVWTPDDRMVYVSDQSGDFELWTVAADGSDPKQLTSDGIRKRWPAISSDGKWIYYVGSTLSGGTQVMKVSSTGGNSVPVLTDIFWSGLSASSEGNLIVYSALVDGFAIRKAATDGNSAETIVANAYQAQFSPVSNQFSALMLDTSSQHFSRIGIFGIDGAQLKSFDVDANLAINTRPTWTADGKNIIYVKKQGADSALWSQPLSGGAARRLLTLDPPETSAVASSLDGKYIALERRSISQNAILVTGF